MKSSARSWLCFASLFFGIDELADFGALLIEIGKMLGTELLIDLQLLLGEVFFASANIGLRETIMNVGEIGIELARFQIFGDGFGIFALIGIEIAQLLMSFGKIRGKSNSSFQE